MTEDRSLDSIREQKIAELRSQVDPEDNSTDIDRSSPVSIDGADELSAIVNREQVVLADFYADWCGPCQMIEPIVADIAAESSATVAKIDIDDNQALAAEYGVRGVPTLLLFVDGEIAEQLVGVQQKDKLQSLIDRHSN